MTVLRQTVKISSTRKATAAYNFVPVTEEIVPTMATENAFNWFNPALYSGKIECTLETMTPLYVRGALEQNEQQNGLESKDKVDFFYVDPHTKGPVIPGSSLRGVFRTLYEIITYGKLQPVTDRQLVFRTLDDSAIGKEYRKRMLVGNPYSDGVTLRAQAGYMELKGGTYRIRPAQHISDTGYYKVEQQTALRTVPTLNRLNSDKSSYSWMRQPVWFVPAAPSGHSSKKITLRFAMVTQISMADEKPGPEWQKGILIASGWAPRKHRHWIIGPPNMDDKKCIPLDDRDIEIYQEEGVGLTKDILDQNMSVLPQFENERIPCFYIHWQDSTGRQRTAFGHTGMMRLPYEYSPQDFLPESHKQQILDSAEALFGWVDNETGTQIASRLSFSDAYWISDGTSPFLHRENGEKTHSALLSSPKPTSFQHYLVQRTDVKNQLYTYHDVSFTTLRGHKLYWHKGPNIGSSDIHSDAVGDRLSTQFHPLKTNVTFEFRIRFENLSNAELGALAWILQKVSNQRYCLKVGMGKPLGMGSVSLTAKMHIQERQCRYREFLTPGGEMECWRDADLDSFVMDFEQHMSKITATAGVSNFDEIPRIQMLLKLLEWMPSPDDSSFSETLSLKQFKERPVLPDPLNVVNEQNDEPIVRSEISKQDRQSYSHSEPSPVPATTKREVQFTTPTSSEEVVAGMHLEGKIVRIESGRIVIDILGEEASLALQHIIPPSVDQYDLEERFPTGATIKIFVRGRNKQKRLQLTMKKP